MQLQPAPALHRARLTRQASLLLRPGMPWIGRLGLLGALLLAGCQSVPQAPAPLTPTAAAPAAQPRFVEFFAVY